jgi:hypothetical protein
MVAKKIREFHCGVVNETVRISLVKRRTAGLRSNRVFFVQCDQNECQYVESNEPPCPLDLSLFEDEIEQREEATRRRREEAEFG